MSARTRAPTWRRRARGWRLRAGGGQPGGGQSRDQPRHLSAHHRPRSGRARPTAFPSRASFPRALSAGRRARAERASGRSSPSIHQADAQAFIVKQIEGELLPTVSIEGRVQHAESFDTGSDPNSATITGRVTIPIYQGGAVSARVRQSKEQYGLRKIEIDLARDQVRAAVVSAWAQEEAARGAILAAREGVEAAEIALSGVQEEQRVGQRTTLDVLDAQQEFLLARETLIIAERDRVVASYALLSAMGRLTGEALSLPVDLYDPTQHYREVRGKWYGLRTPDGR